MATIGVVSSALSDHEHQVQLRRAVIASTIGTAIEWYDFFLYSVVTGLVFAKLFFPNSDPLVGGAVAGVVGIEGGVVSGVINLESSGCVALETTPGKTLPASLIPRSLHLI